MEEGFRPFIQPPRRIPLHLKEPLRLHIEELKEYGVVEGPLEEEEEGMWISNLVITGKAWDKGEKREGRGSTSGATSTADLSTSTSTKHTSQFQHHRNSDTSSGGATGSPSWT